MPMRVFLTDGSVYDIKHPDMALVTRSYLETRVASQSGPDGIDRRHVCSLIHIVRIEIGEPESDERVA